MQDSSLALRMTIARVGIIFGVEGREVAMMAVKKQFAVIGLGRFGESVAKTLYTMGFDVLAIDSDEERVQGLMDSVTHVAQADATDESALKSLGIRNFDIVVVAIGQNLEASVLVTVLLKELGVPYVLAKAQSELHGKVLSRTGADKVIYPERDMGTRVARQLVSENIVDYIDLAADYSLVEVAAPPEFVGKNLRQLALRDKYGLNVLAIKRGREVNVSPLADDYIADGDLLVVVGDNNSIKRLERE